MKVMYFDTETTGLRLPESAGIRKQPYIIDIGAVIVENGELIEKYSSLVRPPVPIPDEITSLTGIADKTVQDAPDFRSVWEIFGPKFESADFVVAHNAMFDIGMLRTETARIGAELKVPQVICTVQEFYPIFGRIASLSDVYEKVLRTPLIERHRALSDAEDLYKICRESGIPAQEALTIYKE